ncbi:MAG: radical SAM protein [Candidatus Omnitrophica bacterium]|nr:radical SAM protein [Candidatus Omnitrophota bacterium]MDD5591881.1 radical SAM protein [Candidatus Omnitrophota bacterium]
MKVLLVAYDDDSYMHRLPQGLAYIAAVLIKEGHEVKIYNQDKFHYPDSHLTEYLDQNKFDIIGLGIVGGYYQYRKLLGLSQAINNSVNRPFYIIGGHGPSPEPEFYLKKTKADAVVIGEGEITVVELLDAVRHQQSLSKIKGIAYLDGDKAVINERRPLIEDIDKIPFPAYELFPMDYYRLARMPNASRTDFVISVLSGRGCTFKCTFCYRMDTGFRSRSSKGIIDEIMFLKRMYGITYIAFSDELLMSSKERTMRLCEDFIRDNVGVKWSCNGRLNYATPEVLNLMKRAGCVFINYGIEAMDNDVLKNMHKGLTTDQIIRGVEATLKSGISPGLNIIFGNIGDNQETLKKGVEFLLKYSDGAQMRTIRPVTPYPGSPLYYYAIEKGLIKDCEDFYENKHLNTDLLAVNFTDMSDDEFYRCLYEANNRLLEFYFQKKLSEAMEQNRKLHIDRDVNFRGFRHL